jgi:hypothetical protein
METTMRKVWSVSIALAALAVLSSCSAIDAISSAGRTRGTFELTTVNGTRVPAVIYSEPGYRVEVLNANFTLEGDGTYTEAGIVREVVNGSASTSSSSSYGTYDYYNGEITFYESNGRQYYGSLDGYTLIIEDQGITMEYRRY